MRVRAPGPPAHDFESMEDVCDALIGHDEFKAWSYEHGSRPKVCLVMFDEETERLAEEAGIELILPAAGLRRRIDSKIVTTRLGNEAGVASAPNVLGHADTYEELLALAHRDALGYDPVVQTPYGDSGKTTFFISGPSDWDRHAEHLIGEDPQGDAADQLRSRCDGGGYHPDTEPSSAR